MSQDDGDRYESTGAKLLFDPRFQGYATKCFRKIRPKRTTEAGLVHGKTFCKDCSVTMHQLKISAGIDCQGRALSLAGSQCGTGQPCIT
jgi:hypothetical protein